MDDVAFRARFPVFPDTAYLNAGTCGPTPLAAHEAARAVWDTARAEGRSGGYYERLFALREPLREAYARLLHADPGDVALTTCTSEGVGRVVAGLGLGPGDEVLTAPDEHPGLLGPLLSLARRTGATIRTAPFADLAGAVTSATTLVACSHVSWITGACFPAALADTGVPLLLDGAQGAGAVPADVAALGCAFYAGSGQKWLCGPVGTGMLWVDPAWSERLTPWTLTYVNLETAAEGLAGRPAPGARRHDAPAQGLEVLAPALAAIEVLEAAGWDAVHERARTLAAGLAERLEAAGREVAPRGPTTLVSWASEDPVAERDRLAAAGVVVRDLPGTPYVRASVGAWSAASDLERLLDIVSPA